MRKVIFLFFVSSSTTNYSWYWNISALFGSFDIGL